MSLAKARKLKGVRPRYDKVGSAETSDFPKDTELELDSLGTIALEGGTSSGGAIERAVDVVKTQDMLRLYSLRDCQRGKIRSARKVKT